jgi:hypothetical protein
MAGKIYLSVAAGVKYDDKRLLADASVCGLQWPLININVGVCVCVCTTTTDASSRCLLAIVMKVF